MFQVGETGPTCSQLHIDLATDRTHASCSKGWRRHAMENWPRAFPKVFHHASGYQVHNSVSHRRHGDWKGSMPLYHSHSVSRRVCQSHRNTDSRLSVSSASCIYGNIHWPISSSYSSCLSVALLQAANRPVIILTDALVYTDEGVIQA